MNREHLATTYLEEVIIVVFFRDVTKFHFIHVLGVRCQATSSKWKTKKKKNYSNCIWHFVKIHSSVEECCAKRSMHNIILSRRITMTRPPT